MAVDQAIPAVLFVLGLIYSGLLVIAFFRTYKIVFRKGPRSESHKVFIAFYTFMWVVLTLTISLYMVAGQPFGRGLEQRFNASIVVLYFLPTILMVLAYVLLYQQLELLMNASRIPTSGSYRNKEKKEKLAKYGRIIANIVISLFLITELVLMFISLLSFIKIRTFYETLYISFIIVIISMNLNQAVVYFKLVGSPYKSTEHYQKIRYLGIICGVWSFAFAIKFIAFTLGGNLFTAEESTSMNRGYATALLLAVEDFLTIVIPVFLVVEKDFISIMAAEFLEQQKP